MQSLRPTYSEPEEVRDTLLRLFGVTEEPFLRATATAWLEWAARSEFDAPSFPGTLLWGHCVRHERRQLVQLGWRKDDTGNFASVITPDGRTAVAVETGNRFTGTITANKTPKTNSRKGSRTLQMLSDNRAILQGSLFTGFTPPQEPKNADAPLLWIHLIHQSRGHVYGEISLPTSANDRSRIVGWRTRIILPKWRGDDGGGQIQSNPFAPTAGPEVRVVRRAG